MQQIDFFKDYNLASTSYIYGRFAPWQPARKRIKTSGASTTVTSETASDGAFDEVVVGDEIYVNTGTSTNQTNVSFFVSAKASADSITASSSVTIPGQPYQFRSWLSGTASTDGWVGCDHLTDKTVHWYITTLNATSITISIEVRFAGGNTTQLYTSTKTADTIDAANINTVAPVQIPESAKDIRVGFKIDTDTGANSVTASLVGKPYTFA